jgi:transposase
MASSPPREPVSLIHERVDDLPVIIEFAKRIGLPEILERHLGTHGNQKGLGNGALAVGWLAFILSQGDHAKYKVEPWVEQHLQTLQRLLGEEFRSSDFNDDRLATVLRRLGDDGRMAAIEDALWHKSVAVYDFAPSAVWVDSTTAYGHHEPQPGGLMQNGHSKDHRPDLAQLKLMVAVAQPMAQLMASQIHPGNAADDPLYVPLIKRVREMIGRSGMLYVGDSKMAALSSRAEIVRAKDKYLVPLPLTGKTAELLEGWRERALAEPQLTAPLFGEDGKKLGIGYELTRQLNAKLDGRRVSWTERVLVVRSDSFAEAAADTLSRRLEQATEQIRALTPDPGRGRRQFHDSGALEKAIDKVLKQHRVEGLLRVRFEPEERSSSSVAKRTANGERPVRLQITAVLRQEARIAEHEQRLGWRAYGTNARVVALSLEGAVRMYRQGWAGERGFHILKAAPLGISPLHVRCDEQIAGLTYLLTLAQRLLTLIQFHARETLRREKQTLAGLYEGNPGRSTAAPTGLRLLRAIAAAQVTLTRVDLDESSFLHLTPLPPLLVRILELLDLPTSIYERLSDTS